MKREPLDNIDAMHNHCAVDRLRKWQKENKSLGVLVGMYVKLGFQVTAEPHKKEWMWVRITKDCGVGLYKGVLYNDPILVDDLYHGDTVEFRRDEICEHQTFLLN